MAPARGVVNEDDPVEVHGNEILVLAPRLRGQLDVPQKPVEVLNEDDIAAYGSNSIAELLDAIAPQTGSGRGRGSGRPVMLVNGRRITGFREMQNIPPEAIRRMEVLPEEVALRFGYAANQRVVNIILKDQFSAMTGEGEYNRPTRGGYDNYELGAGLFQIAGPRRYNFSVEIEGTSMLTEAERDLVQASSTLPTVAGDPDPARFRSLTGANHTFALEGNMTQGIGKGGLDGSITVNGGYTRANTESLAGLDTVVLTSGGQSAVRTLPDPLRTRGMTDTFNAGLGFSKQLGDWQFSTTADGSYVASETRSDRRRDTSALVQAAAAGTLPITGPLPAVAGAGIDLSRNRSLSLSSLATLSGTPLTLPAGEASLTVKAGYNFNHSSSNDSRTIAGPVKLHRGDLLGGVNLALPVVGDGFLDAIGEVSLNFSGGIDRLSDFGTIKDWSAGVTWSPTDTLSFQASYLVNEAAPSLSQLGSPAIQTFNVPVYDFTRNTTALVTVTSGGNPNLSKEKQRDIKLSASWKLPFLDRSNLIVEYFRNRSTDVTQSFPLLTPAVEAAFPGRVTRDAGGNLIAIDQRAVTFDEVSGSRLRWGINLSGSLGTSSSAWPRRPEAAAPTAAPAPAAAPATDPSRFAAMRQQFCAPGASAPDPATIPEGLRARLLGADGKVDPEKLAQFKARACSSEAPAFDPERMARMRAALCGSGSPDPAALPPQFADRLKGADGKIDPARLAAVRERMCRSDGASTMPPPPAGGASPMARERGPGAGGPPMMMGGPRGPGSRWNIAVYHTWRFTDRVRIAPGIPVLDQLAGDSIAAGGVARHAIEAEGGLFKNGYGLRLNAKWSAPAHVDGTGLPGSSDLRFGSTFDVNLRLFADLGRNEALVAKMPFLKGARLSLTADNLLDSRQKVTDANGDVPIAYQAAYRAPQGRVIGIDFRKMF